jgi:antitoxin component YwqK of YwqJK toxin-antitoxin module
LVRKGDFIKSGLEIHYYPSGEIQEVESGLLLQSGNINQRDNTNGLFSERYFYKNGQLAEIEIYIDNKKIVRYWDENGKPIAIEDNQ